MPLDNVFLTLFLYPVSKAIRIQAKIAQLVEHNLAKVGVASSSLVFRSLKKLPSSEAFLL